MSARPSGRRRGSGATLLELIMFIVIVGASVAGVLGAISYASRASVDPMFLKQALAIAEALMEEVQLQTFTYCDPDDDNAATALDAGGCATLAEGVGPEAGESRTGDPQFDNVNDYQLGGAGGPGLTVNPISDLAGAVIPGLGGYSANIRVAAQALHTVPAGNALLITVTVTGPNNTTVVLDGYRARYAPNALP
jgi:MSHA pilin protein MshD